MAEEEFMTGYCVKCKEKGREMKDIKVGQTKKGGYIAKGACVVCGCKMCRMMSKEDAEKLQ